jgi:hypothetical protein
MTIKGNTRRTAGCVMTFLTVSEMLLTPHGASAVPVSCAVAAGDGAPVVASALLLLAAPGMGEPVMVPGFKVAVDMVFFL